MVDFTEYIGFFWLFDFSTSWWEVKMIKLTEYNGVFRLLDLLLGGQNNWYYTEYIDFFQIFHLVLGGQLSDFAGYIIFFRRFDFLTSRREVRMIDFTDYIDFLVTFCLFDLLVGGKNDLFYLIYWIFRLYFSTSWLEIKMINFTEYIGFFEFSTSSWEVKLTDFIGFFDFSTFRPLAGS